MEKLIKRNTVFEGKIIDVYQDDVLLDSGRVGSREVVNHHGGATIAIEDFDGTYFMVKQYRYAVGEELLEFPAGKLELNESPLDAIVRESHEEVGVIVKDVKEYGYMIPTCGYCNEKIYMYSAKVDSYTKQALDQDEQLEVCKLTLSEIMDAIKSGLIKDAKTIILAYHLYSNVMK
ncbi:MAG: NUDIX hydrolase [Erysipelotrichaceae bacterium]|nr:NUDIX hydrolase [Erysipelotrichaceae bacterium]MDO5085593.1 NUDIX hydrolase [Erysipelotrichaceae bacterium]